MKLIKSLAVASALLFSVSAVTLNADDCSKKCNGKKAKAKTECMQKAKAECESKKSDLKAEKGEAKAEKKLSKNEKK